MRRCTRASSPEPRSPGGRRVEEGREYRLRARLEPLGVREPARVVAVVEQPDRVGFVYGALDGHAVTGEEAFVLSRTTDDDIRLTLRSLTRRARSPAPR